MFGEGPKNAKTMFVGERPGDKEDLAGHPFVGPAGRLLDEALDRVGIDRTAVYLANVVKHFKWVPDPRGKRRINKKPRYSEINACRPWLDAEIAVLKAEILVCLGATAAQALLGKDFSVTRNRGKFVPSDLAPSVMATVHPSSILRARDDQSRREQMDSFHSGPGEGCSTAKNESYRLTFSARVAAKELRPTTVADFDLCPLQQTPK